MSNFLNKPYSNAEVVTPGTDLKSAGRGLSVRATTAGNVVIKLASGNLWTIAVALGQSVIDNVAVLGIVVAGTTAAGEFTVLS